MCRLKAPTANHRLQPCTRIPGPPSCPSAHHPRLRSLGTDASVRLPAEESGDGRCPDDLSTFPLVVFSPPHLNLPQSSGSLRLLLLLGGERVQVQKHQGWASSNKRASKSTRVLLKTRVSENCHRPRIFPRALPPHTPRLLRVLWFPPSFFLMATFVQTSAVNLWVSGELESMRQSGRIRVLGRGGDIDQLS